MQKEGAYALIQSTKPQSLAAGLERLTRGFGSLDDREISSVERL